MNRDRAYAYDVLISYRWVDPDLTWVRQQLVPALKTAGLRVCLDVEDFVPGRDLIAEMSRAGSESARTLCVLSPDYFEGNRMVGFESLMARRRDPAGAESRLIPLVLRPAQIPESIRGLIPVDWTDAQGLAREWRKLLQTLNAPKPDAPRPCALELGDEASHATSPSNVTEQTPVAIVSATKLVPRTGSGLGYDVVLKNDSYEDIFATAAEISGTFAKVCHGAGPTLQRLVYNVVLDSCVMQDHGPVLDGIAYDESTEEFGARCTGKFTHEIDTKDKAQKLWQYSLSVPIYLRIPAKDRVVLRLLFRRNCRSLVEEITEGDSGGGHESDSIIDAHQLIVKLESGASVSTAIKADFLELISNRDELSADQQAGYSFALLRLQSGERNELRAEQDFSQEEQRAGLTKLLFLKSALADYQMARELLAELPRDYHDQLERLDRSIAKLEARIARPNEDNSWLEVADQIRKEVIARPATPGAPPQSIAPLGHPINAIILFLAANPDGVSKLALDEESRAVRTKIRATDYRDSLRFQTEWAVRPDDLLQYLNEHHPHVVHFSGHGSPSEELILHSDGNEPKPVTKQALRALFATLKDNIHLVVLNACYSRAQAEAIVEVIDCAVGMRRAIGDAAAIVFAASFYRALGFGRSVKEAFEQGRTALLLEGIPEENTPDLLVRQGVDAARVFLVGPAANP